MEALTDIYRTHAKTTLFTSAAALRILLAVAFPALPDLLTGRVEVSTPVSSFKRLQEGLFLYERGLDPYDGGIFHQAPLLLPLFSLLPSPATWIGGIVSVLLYTGLDLLSANSLYQIAESGAATTSKLYSSPRKDRAWIPISVAAVYLFNPLTLLTCLGRPTTVFTTFFVLLAINHACQAKTATSAFALAIASYMSLHPAFLLPPIGLLCYDRLCYQHSLSKTPKNDANQVTTTNPASDQEPSPQTFTLHLLTTFTQTLILLLALSLFLLPSHSPAFLLSLYAPPLNLPDLTPNPGQWWYFFTEIFDAFRPFFLGVFTLHMLSYSAPFCLRLRKQPLAAVILMQGVVAVFEPYANVGAVGAWLSGLCLLGHVFELSSTYRYPFPALAALLYCCLLGPAFHHLWIYAGSGNANFFYAITLVWNLALLVLLTDTLYAALRDEWESEGDADRRKGREVRQI